MPPRRPLAQIALDYKDLHEAWYVTSDAEPIAWDELVQIHGELLRLEAILNVRFPLPHTPDGDEITKLLVALH